ncbi:Hypothetical protein SMAX5B_004747 [Scophthalmus maximus]|uniref:Uncharacterized protein n=1 Tax=Scophthalmus maximus TaxID=52904 RepID=A0A2U9B6H1_SCOMX|nr:Hypothetical protein SMAX5B_004747 [Scophthalmus maximus]
MAEDVNTTGLHGEPTRSFCPTVGVDAEMNMSGIKKPLSVALHVGSVCSVSAFIPRR